MFCSMTWWRHQMETFAVLLPLCAGNSSVTGEFPSQRPVTRSFDVFFDLRMKSGWANNRDAGDLRRHHAHYDVTVMELDEVSASVMRSRHLIHNTNYMYSADRVTWTYHPLTCDLMKYHLGTRHVLQWRHNKRDGVSNHHPHDCLLNRLFRRRSKKTSKLRVTGLCEGNSPMTGEFTARRASNAGNVSIWWRHHGEVNYHRLQSYSQTSACAKTNNQKAKCAYTVFHW